MLQAFKMAQRDFILCCIVPICFHDSNYSTPNLGFEPPEIKLKSTTVKEYSSQTGENTPKKKSKNTFIETTWNHHLVVISISIC